MRAQSILDQYAYAPVFSGLAESGSIADGLVLLGIRDLTAMHRDESKSTVSLTYFQEIIDQLMHSSPTIRVS
jgi:hypothetical protein